MKINVFAKVDFESTFSEKNINDDTVEDSGEFFICIDPTGGLYNSPYFSKPHVNVLHMIFDDVESPNGFSKWAEDEQMFFNAVPMTIEQAHEIVEFCRNLPDDAVVNIHCAKGESRSVAIASFLTGGEGGNQYILQTLRECAK